VEAGGQASIRLEAAEPSARPGCLTSGARQVAVLAERIQSMEAMPCDQFNQGRLGRWDHPVWPQLDSLVLAGDGWMAMDALLSSQGAFPILRPNVIGGPRSRVDSRRISWLNKGLGPGDGASSGPVRNG